jgi:NADH-quinone oxidoreductase subunit E
MPTMLTPEEKARIVAEIRHHPEPRAAAVEALNLAQEGHRWISDSILQEVAELLGMSAAELDALATFYSFIYRRPVGKRVIAVCESVSCWIAGAREVQARLLERLGGIAPGEVSADGRFTLLPVPCLGSCERAPAVFVDRRILGPLDPERASALLDEGA